jgi:outer membrane receptor protein involved in Fe transport
MRLLVFIIFALPILALQTYSYGQISGWVQDTAGIPIAGVNILIKGAITGTTTDIDGRFSFSPRQEIPFGLIFSMVGFENQEILISESTVTDLKIILQEQAMILGQEIVVSASRIEESILESPVSIEKLGVLDIRNTASDSYYKSIANLKGVDMTTSSINFQIFNARGFNSTGNTRFVQLIDGMDTQAPALNFSIGSLTGPSDLDVETIELVPGAASALYGPNAFNGILLITSKNPFEYQGLSAYYKQGINHLGSTNLNARDPLFNPTGEPLGPGSVQPMFEGSLRYAQDFNNKFAFKFNFTFSKATDWYGTSLNDRNFLAQPDGLNFNPGADRLHAYGDEVAISLGLLAANPAFTNIVKGLGLDPRQLPNVVVSRTPYLEEYLVDYNAKNLRGNAGFYYRINDKMELSYNYNVGFGTTVYTGAQRYSLANFNIQQHKIELRAPNYFIRAYTTLENSGDSYIADLAGIQINDTWQTNENWFGKYGISYLISTQINGLSPENAHLIARNFADLGRLAPGTTPFTNAKEISLQNTIPAGAKFADNSSMYHVEGQYNFGKNIEYVDILLGASYRLYKLSSNGTIFADSPGKPITISEYGGFMQASKSMLRNKLKLMASLRYDKNENFTGQVSPRLSAVVKPAKGHNFRLSFQTGFRNPTTQGQHIDLNVVAARLIGGLDFYREKYNIFDNAYSALSVEAFIKKIAESGDPLQLGNPEVLALLEKVESAEEVKPEQVTSFEIGYKSLIDKTLMFDVALYYNIYHDFITQIQVRKAAGEINIAMGTSNDPGDANYWGYHPSTEQNIRNAQLLLTPVTTVGQENTFQTYTNFNQRVTSAGMAFGVDYVLGRGYVINGNYNWNKLLEGLSSEFLNDFNTPEHKFNVGISNRKLTDRLGFNIIYRWQSAFRWEAGFGRGDVPAVGTIDAQVSYRLPSLKSHIKIGGSNSLNTRHVLSFGGPTLGAIYYVTITFDQLLN